MSLKFSGQLRRRLLARCGSIVFACGASAFAALAQESEGTLGASSLVEEVVVTARKREEALGEVPLSVSALNADQIETLKVRDLTSLAVGMPNVALDEVGTTRGTANFSIRGLGVNSSIPSIDPTVGVFVDGVYMGLNNGIVFDMFDLQSIEVLRGPQGILFGRNVTGGAILLNTKKPPEEFTASARFAAEGGGEEMNYYVMGSVGGPLSDSLRAKAMFYTNQDGGWFENRIDGSAHGEASTYMFRPSILWEPRDDIEVRITYEYSNTDDDGAAAQSHTNGSGIPNAITNSDRDSHDFAIDETGFQENEVHFVSARLDWHVLFGNGTVTNIFGWRDFESVARSDIDGTVDFLFHADPIIDARQYSNELRYSGVFNERLRVTTGLYYFDNEIAYHEQRELLGELTPNNTPAVTQDGGGDYSVETLGVFVALDYDITDQLTLTGGIRYTDESKEADIASLILNVNSPCDVTRNTCPFDFRDDDEWSSWSPKVGVAYEFNDNFRTLDAWLSLRGLQSAQYGTRYG